MDIEQFGRTLTTLALVGLAGCFVWSQSGISGSWAESLFFQAQRSEYVKLQREAALNRAKGVSGAYEDRQADNIGAVRETRAADGKTGMMIFGAFLVVGIAIRSATGGGR